MNKRCYGLTFYSLVVLLTLSSLSEAAIYKVKNAEQLQSALTDSQYNGEHDTIRIAQGNYVGNFIYSSHADEDLTLEGGWNSVFSSKEAKAENTVLDGNKTGNTFVFSCDKAANLTIDSITFQNGLTQTGKEGSGIFISIICRL